MTATVDDVLREVDKLERLQGTLGGIAKRNDDARSRELIAGRRDLVGQMNKVAEMAGALFGRHDPELEREFRNRFSAMRAAVAHLQANWPAVKARDDATGDYVRAVTSVRQADMECLGWMRVALARMERSRA